MDQFGRLPSGRVGWPVAIGRPPPFICCEGLRFWVGVVSLSEIAAAGLLSVEISCDLVGAVVSVPRAPLSNCGSQSGARADGQSRRRRQAGRMTRHSRWTVPDYVQHPRPPQGRGGEWPPPQALAAITPPFLAGHGFGARGGRLAWL